MYTKTKHTTKDASVMMHVTEMHEDKVCIYT